MVQCTTTQQKVAEKNYCVCLLVTDEINHHSCLLSNNSTCAGCPYTHLTHQGVNTVDKAVRLMCSVRYSGA